ncbi:LptF/LptG family permease, partial [Planctomycetota bacterium]
AAVTELVIPRVAGTIRAAGGLRRTRTPRPGFMRDAEGNTLFAGGYDRSTETLRWVTFRERDSQGRLQRVYHGDIAAFVRRGPDSGVWRLMHGWVRQEDSGQGTHVSQRVLGEEGADLHTSIVPIDVESMSEGFSLLSFSDLRKQCYDRQSYLHRLRVQLHQRITSPLAHVVLCLLGVPFVLRRTGRASIFLGILALIAICLFYFLATFFFFELGSRGSIDAFWAAWIPTIAFTLMAVALWHRVRT